MNIEEIPIAPRSPWQNSYVERPIGCAAVCEALDYVIARDEHHLRGTLRSYVAYYNKSRTHFALGKDAPIPRPAASKSTGKTVAFLADRGLHHRYERIAA